MTADFFTRDIHVLHMFKAWNTCVTVQYSPKIMHKKELLFVFASQATSCGRLWMLALNCVLKTTRTSLHLESFNSKNFFVVRLRNARISLHRKDLTGPEIARFDNFRQM